MSAKIQWLLRIPAIRSELSRLTAPVVDREVIERLFGLKRRRAIDLMHRFGGYQAGRTLLIDRNELLAQLAAMEQGEDFDRESRRHVRLASDLDQLRPLRMAAAVRIPVEPDVFSATMSKLGAGIRFHPGRLEIDFAGTEDLLSKLFVLAQAAANDFEAFRSSTEPLGNSNAKAPAEPAPSGVS